MTTKTSNRLITILILLFGVSFVLNCVQWRSAKNQENNRLRENLRFQAVIEVKRAEILKADSVVKRLEDQMSVDKAIHESVVNRLKTRLAILTAKLPVLEPITPHEDTICARFIASTIQKDTIIAVQDTLIHKLEDRATELVGSFRKILAQKDTAMVSQIATCDMWQGQASNFEKLYRKADKQAKKRVSIGPYIGVGWPGPVQVGVGVHYSIVRF
jgi:uncharacterized protein (DUF1697 family)